MAQRLKDIYLTSKTINTFAEHLANVSKKFNKNKFLNLTLDEKWEERKLKERMRHTSKCLHETLPGNYKNRIKLLMKVAPKVKGFEGMILPDYVEVYGHDDWETSLAALGYFTKYASSEFAIRPFLDKDPEKGMKYLLRFADDENENVRRFASEGCRPRLPWATALPKFKTDPSLIIPVLEKLKNDDSEFVRKSVANNLNDISKDNPDFVLVLSEKWYGKSSKTDWIIKHALRTLLKAGNKRAMNLFGYKKVSGAAIKNFKLKNKTIKIGSNLEYSFILVVNIESKVRIEYGLDYIKANGKHSRKIFQISEKMFSVGEHMFERKQHFKELTTRKHYSGGHMITLIINGVEKESLKFNVIK